MNSSRPIILASKSPRRQQLIKLLGLDFRIRTKYTDESFPNRLEAKTVARYLAEKKAKAFKEELTNELVITADTTVVCNNAVLNKPADYDEAFAMLELLSGSSHEVVTGVCLMEKSKFHSFDCSTRVYFKALTEGQIDAYIKKCSPYDKAGAYGIQELTNDHQMKWYSSEEKAFIQSHHPKKLYPTLETQRSGLPFNFIKHIKGSYFNVVGLPVVMLFDKLQQFNVH